MIDLDETIKLFRNNAEYVRKQGDLQGCLAFRQYADWLEELKKLRAKIEKILEEAGKLPISWEYGQGVSDVMNIIKKNLEEQET